MKNIHKCNFSEDEIGIIFNRPRWCTLSSILREFQFKLLHGIVYTNHHLQMFNFVDTNSCSFCNKHDVTYQHLFYACEVTRTVWEGCNNLFGDIDLSTLSWEEIQFGIDLPNKGKGQLVNHVLLVIKLLLFLGRKTKQPPTLLHIKSHIEHDKVRKWKVSNFSQLYFAPSEQVGKFTLKGVSIFLLMRLHFFNRLEWGWQNYR